MSDKNSNIKSIKISNFKLNVFMNLLEQSLNVENQLMLEFSSEMIKSCSFSATKSFLKLWIVPIEKLIEVPKSDELTLEEPEVPKFDFQSFNFYVLKGDSFKKYLSVNSSQIVDLEFNVVLNEKSNKYQASNIIVTSILQNGSKLVTSFMLATEDLISNQINDYADIIRECTPSEKMSEFILTNHQIQEIKRLIKTLHGSSPNNSAFLTFTIDSLNNKIIVNDKVFTIDFDLNFIKKSPTDTIPDFKFNILKSDFVMSGNHTFSIYANQEEQKIIFGGTFLNSIIWGLLAKVDATNINLDNSIMDSTIDSLNLAEYDLGGDMPF